MQVARLAQPSGRALTRRANPPASLLQRNFSWCGIMKDDFEREGARIVCQIATCHSPRIACMTPRHDIDADHICLECGACRAKNPKHNHVTHFLFECKKNEKHRARWQKDLQKREEVSAEKSGRDPRTIVLNDSSALSQCDLLINYIFAALEDRERGGESDSDEEGERSNGGSEVGSEVGDGLSWEEGEAVSGSSNTWEGL